MRFMMLVIPKDYGDAKPDAMPDPKMIETMEKYNDRLRQAGALISLDGLRPPSAGARIVFSHGQATVSRSPFAGTKETLGGFWMIRAKSQDEAIEWASRAPMSDGDIIEVRQVQETEDFPAEVRKVLAAEKPMPSAEEKD
jgi:hypothetical protein